MTDPTTALTIATLFGLCAYTAGHLAIDTARLATRLVVRARRWRRSEPDPESVRRMADRIRAQVEWDANRPPVTLDEWRDAEAEKRISWGRAR